MFRRAAILLLAVASVGLASVPTPKEHLGFTPGDPQKLADYADVTSYFRKLAAASDRIQIAEFGKSAEGKPLLVAFISDPENLRALDRYRAASRRLALGQATAVEARKLAAEGKAIVWVDSGLHASEVAPVQHSFDLAYRMVTGEDDETRRIRANVILLQVPVINPDGLDWIAHWYRSNVGTPYEIAPLPRLYHKYAGHDNNRDWFMMNLVETRAVSKMLFEEWFPQIVYNQHQVPAFPARIFVPPYAEPLNPNIPAAVMEGITLLGSAMKERFAREDKPGVLSYHGYDAWWNGGLRSVPCFHNMHGILTETAGFAYATPGNYRAADLPDRFTNGLPTREPTVFYPRPWLGGSWSVRDAIDYMLTADFAILEMAASRREQFLIKAWEMARSNIEAGNKGKPYAYIVGPDQWDPASSVDMLRRLSLGGIQIFRARSEFRANGKAYPAGSYVMPAGQPFRGYLLDLLEPQKYPELRTGVTGPTKRPYDIAGWTLSMSMNVAVDRIEEGFEASLDPVTQFSLPPPSRNRRENSSFIATSELLARGAKLRWSQTGDLLVEGESDPAAFAKAAFELRAPRVAIYEPWSPNMDSGWTQYVLDSFKVSYRTLRNTDISNGDKFNGALKAGQDAIILAAQTANAILHGIRRGDSNNPARAASNPPAIQRPEFTGGIGVQGLAKLEEFVQHGGTLIALDSATELPVQFFGLPLRPALRYDSEAGANSFYSPGSLIRIQVDNSHPIAWGMPREMYAFTTGGQAWDVTLMRDFNKGDREIRSVARYNSSNLLASGWLSGERTVAGKHILLDVRHGKGRIVLFGFRPQFRAQTTGAFKFLLNSIYLAAAKPL